MPAPIYSEDEAALHELGHAAVACALNLDFERVFIEPMPVPADGWRGQCKPGANFPRLQRVLQDAFMMGGALMQLEMLPDSIAPHQALFQPSLFSHTASHFADNAAVLNTTRWSADLMDTHMLYTCPQSPVRHLWIGAVGDRPWLLDLEIHLRAFFGQAKVREFVDDLKPQLVQHKTMPGAQVRAVFAQLVPAIIVAVFHDPVMAVPNVPPPFPQSII